MKRDIKDFYAVCRQQHMTDEERWGFSDYIHDLKDKGFKGSKTNGDFSFSELIELAKEFKGKNDEN